MPRLLLLGLALIAVLYGVRALLPAFKQLDSARRRRLGRAGLALLAALLVIAVLARYGLGRLGAVAAVLWAAVRTLAPWLLSRLTRAHSDRDSRARSAESDRGGSAGGADAGQDARPGRAMSRPEALDVLGLQEGASTQEILQAYRHLMRKVHPDSPGGSTYLATKLNQAREVLIG